MSRPPRIELPGALHHVSWRALERSPLFRDDADRERFLVLLGRTASERAWLVHAFSLLGTALDSRWSSAPATAGLAERPSWLTVDATLRRLSPARPRARERFRRLVSDTRGIRPLRERAISRFVVGSPGFARQVKLRGVAGPAPGERIARGFVDLARVTSAVASRFGVPEPELARPGAHEAKVAAIWLSRRLTGLSGREVGQAFGVRQARVSNVLGDVRSGRWKALRPALDELEKGLLAENE